MATLRIRLFGSVRISHTDWKTEVKATRAIQALLSSSHPIYLILSTDTVHAPNRSRSFAIDFAFAATAVEPAQARAASTSRATSRARASSCLPATSIRQSASCE